MTQPPAAGLFGAPAPSTPVVLVPQVVLAGQVLSSGFGTGPVAGQVVLDELECDWGRSDALEQMEPPTGSFQVFDTTGRWGTSREWVGERADLRWSYTPASGPIVTRHFFRGRIDTVRVARHVVTRTDGTRLVGALVSFTLVSLLAELANITPTEDWAAMSLDGSTASYPLNRMGHIRSRSAAQLPGGIATMRVTTATVGPVKAGEQVSLWEHLVGLYDQAGGDRITYDPEAQSLGWVARRDFRTRRAVGALWWQQTEGTARDAKGVFVRPRALRDPAAGTQPRVYLDARALEYDPSDGVVRDGRSRITRAVVTGWNPDFTARITSEHLVPGVSESLGVRAIRVQLPGLSLPSVPGTIGDQWAELAGIDAAGWKLEPLVMRTRQAGFEDIAQAVQLVRGGETDVVVFLQSSYLPALNVAPVFAIMGGTIAHRDGGWELEWLTAPIRVTEAQSSVTWENIDSGNVNHEIRWHDGDDPRGFHDSVTYEDMAYVGMGLGVTDGSFGPPFTEWDFYTA